MNCHGPDPLELAFAGFSDDDIFRRAEPHVNLADAQKVVDAVHYLRALYEMPERDPMEVRPFQPGAGKPLETVGGDSWSHRDQAFAAYLEGRGFPLMRVGEQIRSIPQAFAVREELHAIDPKTVDLALPFNRLSEDLHRGSEHGILADWFSDMPILPTESSYQDELFALQDAYLQDPSEPNLMRYMRLLMDNDAYFDPDGDPRNTKEAPQSGNLSQGKYELVQLASHFFRSQSAGLGGFQDAARIVFDTPENITALHGSFDPGSRKTDQLFRQPFAVGSVAHFFDGRRDVFPPALWTSYHYDEFVRRERLSPDFSMRQQTQLIRLPWFMAGWLIDPSLHRLGGGNTTRNAEYFSGHLMEDTGSDMMTQALYVMTMKWATEGLEPRAYHAQWQNRPWLNYSAGMGNIGLALNRTYSPGRRHGIDGSNGSVAEFIHDTHEARYVRFASNAIMTRAFVMVSELRAREEQTGQLWDTESEYLNPALFRHAVLMFEEFDPDLAHTLERIRLKIRWVAEGNPFMPADVDVNGVVNISDIFEVVRHIGENDTYLGDGSVTITDIFEVLEAF
ncbi:MAG: hypothetical protein AAGI17_02900 [Planctomycetota bacterium]